MAIILLKGSFSYAKSVILSYCFERFDSEDIWLVDSLQVFDPFAVSRLDISRARRMLAKIMIARPFTFYQLKGKIFTFSKIRLRKSSTVIISGLDCFEEKIPQKEKDAHLQAMAWQIRKLAANHKVIIGLKYPCSLFGEVATWEEQSFHRGMK